MRCRLAALLLFLTLPLLNLLAAPAPAPSAILDIGPPPKGETAEQYRKRMIETQTHQVTLCDWMSDREVKRLPSVAAMKDPRPWLAKNLRITKEGERRLRFAFCAGTRAEQAVILNALLRVHLRGLEDSIRLCEDGIRDWENWIVDLQTRKHGPELDEQIGKEIKYHRSVHIPALRAQIAALEKQKQSAVVKWAR